MLFKALITSDTVKSEDSLVEQLYIFLREFVPNRLRYESMDEREDCIQEAIMYLLSRFKQLTEKDLIDINYERFFYNRARSFVSSIYLRRLQRERKAKKEYLKQKVYINSMVDDRQIEYIDYNILNNIIKKYKLGNKKSKYLRQIVEEKLKSLDFDVEIEPMKRIDDSIYDVLDTLSYTVIDEYLINSATSKGDSGIYY